jgi:hypothetical protein
MTVIGLPVIKRRFVRINQGHTQVNDNPGRIRPDLNARAADLFCTAMDFKVHDYSV